MFLQIENFFVNLDLSVGTYRRLEKPRSVGEVFHPARKAGTYFIRYAVGLESLPHCKSVLEKPQGTMLSQR